MWSNTEKKPFLIKKNKQEVKDRILLQLQS